ncbi:MAG: YraN family protein [Candidatus Sumerlaeaceae bacterium]|nr:YraN family protein [Candidatus Sumerlaeaceae bacterium]
MFWKNDNYNDPHKLGRTGEEVACQFLAAEGYRILERNFRCPAGEIDIIAEHGDTIRFVEVKTRSQLGEFAPEDAVDFEKRRHLRRAARHYLKGFRNPSPSFFDIISLVIQPNGKVELLELRRDAFGWAE